MQPFTFPSTDRRTSLAAYAVTPQKPLAMVQISHGMCEYFGRYEAFADFLAAHGYLVFGHDHLGHGNSAASPEELGFVAEKGGADLLVRDVLALSHKMKDEHPDLPLILFGHSMGSFIAREAIAREGQLYDACVICGTGGPETPAAAGKLLANLMIAFKGAKYRSQMLKKIAFSGYLSHIGQPCDSNDWLTRDAEVVKRYNADPFCTYTFTLSAYRDLFDLVAWVSDKAWAKKLPPSLPLLVIGGEEDPVGGFGKGMRSVFARIREAGVSDATLKLYPGMRHEILNELEKEQVWSDLLQWMEEKRKSLT